MIDRFRSLLGHRYLEWYVTIRRHSPRAKVEWPDACILAPGTGTGASKDLGKGAWKMIRGVEARKGGGGRLLDLGAVLLPVCEISFTEGPNGCVWLYFMRRRLDDFQSFLGQALVNTNGTWNG